MIKPIFYVSVRTGNRGDDAIRKSITDAIQKRIDVPISYFNVKYDEFTEQRIEQLNKDGSCLMIAGSGLYSNANTPSGWYFNCEPELFSKINVPIYLVGLGCNNNLKQDIFGELSDKAKQSIKVINDSATLSTVRDKRTYDILKEIGVTNHKLMLDPACFLDVTSVTKKKHRVAINIAQHAPILGRFDGEEEGQKNREKNIKLFADISNYLISKDYEVVFICHDALEQSLVIDLKKLVPSLEYLNTDDIDKILMEYSRCTVTICVKMHSAIMSFAVGTPFINLYYDQKSIEFLNLIGWKRFGKSIFDVNIEWVKEQIDFLLLNPKYFSIYLKEQKGYYQFQFNNFIDKLCNTLKTTI